MPLRRTALFEQEANNWAAQCCGKFMGFHGTKVGTDVILGRSLYSLTLSDPGCEGLYLHCKVSGGWSEFTDV